MAAKQIKGENYEPISEKRTFLDVLNIANTRPEYGCIRGRPRAC